MAGAGFGGTLLICLLNLTLNEKSSLYSLQFASKYHVSLDSLRPQIWEHTNCNVCDADFSLRVKLRRHIRSRPLKPAPATCYLNNNNSNLNIENFGNIKTSEQMEKQTSGRGRL